MPRTMPAGMAAFLAKQGGSCVPIVLLDIQTIDGTQYFWTDYEGTYLSEITGAQQFYNGWVKSAAPFQTARDLTTNAGDLAMQNLSGNSIDRDVASALLNHEFEGALCIMRLWLPLFDAVLNEFHCYLSEQNPTEDECAFRMLQLFDTSQYDVADDTISEQCTLRFKSAQCGSTGTATVCNKLFSTCQDAQHAAQERFNGVLTVVSTAAVHKPHVGIGGRPGNPGIPPGGISGSGPGRRIPNLS